MKASLRSCYAWLKPLRGAGRRAFGLIPAFESRGAIRVEDRVHRVESVVELRVILAKVRAARLGAH